MATKNKRIYFTPDPEMYMFFEEVSRKGNIPLSKAVNKVLKLAFKEFEDVYLTELAEERLEKSTSFISHEDFWQ